MIESLKIIIRVREMADLCEQLRSAIIQCEIAPGSILVENQLVRKYRSTRAKVRVVLRKLAQEGFLEPIPRMGHLVTLPNEREVDEIFQLRSLLETWTAREAAAKVSDGDIAYLRALDFSVAPGDPESFKRSLGANRQFHLKIAEVAGNSLIIELLTGLLDKVNRILHLGLIGAVQTGGLVDDHLALIDALADRDSKRAEQISRRQADDARIMIEAAIGAYWREGNVGLAIRH